MRLQIASDLHLETLCRRFPGYLPIEPAAADLLVLAGDIASGADAIDAFADWPVPVVYVHGNHEAYDRRYPDVVKAIRARAAGTCVHLLERDEWIAPDGSLRVLGCCLWTDYALLGAPTESMEMARGFMHDHLAIRRDDGERFMPEDALAAHRVALGWLEHRLAEPFAGKTVVVTHHGVAPGSVHPRYAGNPVNAGFVSDLRRLLPRAELWIHGHVHDSLDYREGRARVVVNPRGYARNLNDAATPRELVWENLAFDAGLVVEV